MNFEELQKLHQRQCNIMDLIKRTIERKKEWLDMAAKEHYRIVFGLNYMRRKIAFHEAVKNRLINYYINQQVKIMMLQPELNTTTEMDMATTLS